MPLTLNEAIEVVTKGYPIQYENNIMNKCSFCEQSKSMPFFVYNDKEVCKSCSIIVNDLKNKVNNPIPSENNNKNIISQKSKEPVFGKFMNHAVYIKDDRNELEEKMNKRCIINPKIGEITSNSNIDHFFNAILDNKESELDNYFELNNNNDNLFK